MSTVLYSEISQIRAALGLTDLELSDEAILDLEMEAYIETVMDESFPDHADAIAAGDGGSPAEVKLAKNVRLLCAYEVAVFMLPQLSTIIFQSVGDGDATKTRFNSLETMKARVIDTRNDLIARLKGVASVPLNPIGVSSPAYDPVEG